MIERLMRNAVEIIRGKRPAWAIRCVTEDAVIDADGDGRHNDGPNPDKGAGDEPGTLMIDVFDRAGTLHRFSEVFAKRKVFPGGEKAAETIADAIIADVEGIDYVPF